jgi:hypothetical protein
MSNEADIFDQHYPEITEEEAIQAGQDGQHPCCPLPTQGVRHVPLLAQL